MYTRLNTRLCQHHHQYLTTVCVCVCTVSVQVGGVFVSYLDCLKRALVSRIDDKDVGESHAHHYTSQPDDAMSALSSLPRFSIVVPAVCAASLKISRTFFPHTCQQFCKTLFLRSFHTDHTNKRYPRWPPCSPSPHDARCSSFQMRHCFHSPSCVVRIRFRKVSASLLEMDRRWCVCVCECALSTFSRKCTRGM